MRRSGVTDAAQIAAGGHLLGRGFDWFFEVKLRFFAWRLELGQFVAFGNKRGSWRSALIGCLPGATTLPDLKRQGHLSEGLSQFGLSS